MLIQHVGHAEFLIETENGTDMSFLNAALFGRNFNNLTKNNAYEFTKITVGVAC